MQQLIAEKVGAKVKETWLTGQTADEAVGTMIAGGEYPDFIEGQTGTKQLYEAGALVALDDYLDDYPNIKNLFTDAEWEKLRQEDGHIYWIPQFSCIKNEEKVCTHNDEAFWIQARVLKWADYPEIRTMDRYFDRSKSIMQQILLWKTEQPIFLIPFSVMTGDTSVWRMHLSSWMVILMTEAVW